MLTVAPLAARESLPGPVPATVLRVIDGDSLVVRATIWLGQEVETAVRLLGVDIGQALIDAGLARAYRGGRRDSWCLHAVPSAQPS